MGNGKAFTAKEIAEIVGKSQRTIELRAKKENWHHIEEAGNGRNGKTKKYPLSALPADIQDAWVQKGGINPEMLPALKPSAAALMMDKYNDAENLFPTFEKALTPVTQGGLGLMQCERTKDTAISEQDMSDPRIARILAILREVDAMPKDWEKGKRKWIESVALRFEVGWQTVYKWMDKYEKKGIVGLRHTKSYADSPRKWSPDAVDFWVSLCGQRAHRGANRKDLYDNIMVIEARRRGWTIGGYDSANWWFDKKWNPCLEALQRGGMRALDNILPPILRDYSDLAPFQILVGDQHRFDRWVMDEDTGEIFRPEGYLWQDLRSRTIYGAAVDKKYDAWLIGLALRIGVAQYGAFGSIYTDNGKPEISRFVTSILANLRAHGMAWEKTDELVTDLLDVDAEDIAPCCILPGSHRKAIVKNAKAKMIEGTFHRLEQVMASVMLLPGQTKKMSDDIHWQDVDHQEAQKLAAQGKLLTSREFALALYRACDYYNNKKIHRGVLAEWVWKPKPREATPLACLHACYSNDGWRPRMISSDAADLLFLARDTRIVNKGMISLNNEFYVHDELIALHKERVDLRYNPMTYAECHVYRGGKYLCTAYPVERSSMIDMDLASEKIAEKRERRKRFAEEFQKISSIAPDFRQYSTVPEAERVAALIGTERKQRAIENKTINKQITQEELDRGVQVLEALNRIPKTKKALAGPRPSFWTSDADRHQWCIMASVDGTISAEDKNWMLQYEAAMKPEARDRWEFERETRAAEAQ